MSSVIEKLIRRVSSGFVLAFHDIPAEKLSELVDSLRPALAVPLSELVDRSKSGKSTAGIFAITIDDGVGGTVRELSRLFVQRGWPASFYLSTDYIESRRGMAFQLWRGVMPFLPRRRLELRNGTINLAPAGALEELAKTMERLWHSQRPETYLPLTLELTDLAVRENGLTAEAIQPPEAITWPEVAELGRNELISFESHGVSHAALSALTDEELQFEFKHSRDLIASHTGRSCRHFAYPFGSDLSIGTRASAIARDYYDSAVTMTLGHVDAADPWMLPRIPLYPENSTWFATAKILLKCRGKALAKAAASADRVPAKSRPASVAGGSEI